MTVKEMLLKQLEQEKYSRDSVYDECQRFATTNKNFSDFLFNEYLERKGRVAGFERALALLIQSGVI